MNKLPENFTIERYGLNVRLVEEKDAGFILSLRTNPKLSRYIHNTDDSLDKQREWIREYKKREFEGKDYYFIYYYGGKPIGVNRIYDIHDRWATGGSWVCIPGCDPQQSIATSMILREIMFEILNLEEDRFDVRKGNRMVIKAHKMFGAHVTGESDEDYYFSLSKNSYFNNRQRFIEMLCLD